MEQSKSAHRKNTYPSTLLRPHRYEPISISMYKWYEGKLCIKDKANIVYVCMNVCLRAQKHLSSMTSPRFQKSKNIRIAQ